MIIPRDNTTNAGTSSPKASLIASFKRRFSKARRDVGVVETEESIPPLHSSSSSSKPFLSQTQIRVETAWQDPNVSLPLLCPTQLPPLRRRIRMSGNRLPSGYRPKSPHSTPSTSTSVLGASRSSSVQSDNRRISTTQRSLEVSSPASSALSMPSSVSPASTAATSVSSALGVSKKKRVRFSIDGAPSDKIPNNKAVNTGAAESLLRFGFSWRNG